MVLQYYKGGDCGDLLPSKRRGLSEEAVITLSAEVLLALEELHSQDIIFRDLKSDNVLLDKDGHAILADFGLAKHGITMKEKTKSFCGSVKYLAPEMLNRQGSSLALDWYNLGIFIYEMLSG